MKKINENIKAYFVDLDGTLFDMKNNWISNQNLDAVKKVQKAGKHIIISTGRMDAFSQKAIQTVQGNYSIQLNGAIIQDKNGATIFEKCISLKQHLLLLKIAKKYKLAVKINLEQKGFGVVSWFAKFISRKIGWKVDVDYSRMPAQLYHKIIFFGSIWKSKVRKIIKEIQNNVPEVSAVSSFHGYTIEVTHIEATKGKAARKVAKYLNLQKNEIVHIGDSMNDSTVVGLVEQFIVMSNATREVKKLSQFVGPHFRNAGVAQILKGHYFKKK